MKKVLFFMMALLISILSYGQITISGCTGTGNGTYTTFTGAGGAFAALNTTGSHDYGDAIVISITANVTTETGANALNEGLWTSVTITPSGARTISGTLAAAALITLNGADNVTIDGLNTGGNSLIISNLSNASTSGTSTIKLVADATYNTFTNCSILGSSIVTNTTNGGNIWISTATSTGNDNNTISNCKIGPAGTNLPSKGIYGNGTTTSEGTCNSNITINNCEIYDYFLAGGCAGVYVSTGNTQWNITNNKIYQAASRAMTGTMYGIYLSSSTHGNNVQITGNTIGYANNGGTGTLTLTSTGSFQGIYMSTKTTAADACNINNNMVSNISLTSSSGTFYGIYNASGASSNTININNNTVRNITLITTTGSCYGIHWTSATNMTINGNNVYSITRNGAGALYGIYSGSSSVNETVTNNNVYSLSATSTTTTSTLAGIYQSTAAGTKIFQNNTIHDLSGSYNNVIYGLYLVYGTDVDISGNIIYNISQSGTSATATGFYGLFMGATATSINCYKNKIYDLSSTAANTGVFGLHIAATTSTTRNVYNNLIGNLTASAANTADAIRGIYITAASATSNINVYYNTVYINATSSGATFGSSGIYTTASSIATTATLNLRNNIIVNTSTAKGTGLTVAYRRSAGATDNLANYASTSNKNLFYAGTPGASNLIYYDGVSSAQTLANYKTGVFTAGTIAPRDAASVTENPTWLSTTGSSADFLHISTTVATVIESNASPVSGITTDFDGNTRHVSKPDIGADEFTGIPSITCTLPTPGNTLTSLNNLCLGQSITLSLQNPPDGTGYSYKWQVSPDNIAAYTDISGATLNSYTFTPTVANAYYRCWITCSNGPVSAGSSPVQILFTNSVTSVTNGSRCGSGTVQLGATGSAGTTLKWYDAIIGGNQLPNTGSPWTSPVISADATYYVGAVVSSITPSALAVGAGSTTSATYSNPFYSLWSNIHTQHLVLASELIAAGLRAGNINSVALNITSIGTLPMIDLSVKIGTTSATDMSAFVSSAGLTPVYSNASLMPVSGLNTLTFSPAFYWNGVDNIVLEFCHGNAASSATMSRTCLSDATSYVSSIKTHVSSATAAATICPDLTTNKLTYSDRPQFTFFGNVETSCSSARSPVLATISPAPALTLSADQEVCNNSVATIAVTSMLTDFNSYVWSPATGLYYDASCATGTEYNSSMTTYTTVYYKSTSAGAKTITCTANDGYGCQNIATTVVTNLVVPVITATPSTFCQGNNSIITTLPTTGYGSTTFQWQESTDNGTTFNDITTDGNAIDYTTPVLTATTQYRLQTKNGSDGCDTSNVATITVSNPVVSNPIGASRCGSGYVSLQATPEAGTTLRWYDVATGGTKIGEGSPWNTPIINQTTTFYAAAEIGGGTNTYTGMTACSANPTSGAGTTQTGIVFDVLAPFTLKSVTVYPVSASSLSGTVTIDIIDANSNVLHTYTANVTGSPTTTPVAHVIPVNFNILPGTNLKMRPQRSTEITGLLFEPSAGAPGGNYGYPYVIPGILSINTSTLTTAPTNTARNDLYYYFYNWEISTGCSGTRVPVVATLDPAPALAITANQEVCNNEVAVLEVIPPTVLTDFDTYVWSPATDLYTDISCAPAYAYDGISSATTIYYKSTSAGDKTISCTALKILDGCQNIASTVVTNRAVPVITVTPPTSFCQSGATTLTTLPATGYGSATFQWQNSIDGGLNFNDIALNGTNIDYITPTLNATTLYRLLTKVGSTDCDTSNTATVTINNPTVASKQDGSHCGPGTVVLGATLNPGTTLNWYDVPTGGTSLSTNTTYTTPSLSASKTYYVEAMTSGGGSGNVGPVSNTIGTGSTASLTYYLYFDVLASSMDLIGVHVYPGAVGDVKLVIYDNAGNLLKTVIYPVTTTNVKTFIPIGYTLPAGTDYKIGYNSTVGGVSLYRNDAGAVYPYTIPGIVSITGNSFSGYPAYYYYCYDWQVSSGCRGTRTPVYATITAAPEVTASADNPSPCAGIATNLNASSPNANYTYTWSAGTTPSTGTPVSVSPSVSTIYTVNAIDNSSGSDAGCVTSATVTVNPIITTITGQLNICMGGQSQLSGTLDPDLVTPWSSASPGVITIDNTGLMTAVSNGTSIITYKRDNGCETSVTASVLGAPTNVTATSPVCLGTASLLNATSTGNILWYDAPVGGTLLGYSLSGVDFSLTPAATGLHSYYAASNNGVATVSQTFSYTGAIQNYLVPAGVTSINIKAMGAQGGNTSVYLGGKGAYVEGNFTVTPGSTLKVLAGGQGQILTLNNNTGGGGGSFVWVDGQTDPLICAGGGGGGGQSFAGINASITTDGTEGNGGTNGVPGTGGNGANPGGAGWYSNGTDYVGTYQSCTAGCGTLMVAQGGKRPLEGGAGGCAATSVTGNGGFGGGSGGYGECANAAGSGGGGGYSGGTGQTGTTGMGGGGGGSYSSSSTNVMTAGYQTGNGQVIISYTNITGCESSTRTEVTVLVNPIPTITGVLTVCEGSTTQLSGSGTKAITNPWVSSAPTIASVDNNGLVTGVAVGSTVITYTDINGCVKTATVTVIVSPSLLSVTPAIVNICDGSIQQLVTNGGTIGGSGSIGTGTTASTTYTPYKGYYGGSKIQSLFDASELTAIGVTSGTPITEIAYSIVAFTSPYTFNDFTISMKNTTTTVLTTTWETGLTTVLAPAAFILSGTAPFVQSHTLDTPFSWDGTSNLLIEICFNNNNGGGSSTANSASVLYTAMTGNHCHYYSVDNIATVCSAPSTGTATTYRPNITLVYQTPTTTTWAPQAGLYTNAGATTAYTGGHATTVWAKPTASTLYTATATGGNGCSRKATSDITLKALSIAPTSISGNTSVCPGGSTTLIAEGGTIGTDAAINWYKGSCNSIFSEEWFTVPAAYTSYQTTINSNAGGIMDVTANADNPYFQVTSLPAFDQIANKVIQIRYKVPYTSIAAGTVSIYFTNTLHQSFNPAQKVSVPLISDDNWHIVSIDMLASHANWDDTPITGIRYEWCSEWTANMLLDYFRLGEGEAVGQGSSFTTPNLTEETIYSASISGYCNTTTCASTTVTIAPNVGPVTFTPAQPIERCSGAGSVTYSATESTGTGTIEYTQVSTPAGNGINTTTGAVLYDALWWGTTVITATATGCGPQTTATYTVTTYETPTAVSVTPPTKDMCSTDIQLLTASGGTSTGVLVTRLEENFNGPEGLTGWTKENLSTGGIPAEAEWTLRPDLYYYSTNGYTFSSNDASQFYLSNSDAQGSGGTTATRLISPSFSTIGLTTASISFWHNFFPGTLTAVVEYTINGGTDWYAVPTLTWGPGNDQGTPSNPPPPGFVQASASLPAAAIGEPAVKVRFKLDGDYGLHWALDNVKVEGLSTLNDITWSPTAGLYTDPGAGTGTEYSGGATTTVYAHPTTTTTYTATATALNGCFSIGTAQLNVTTLPVADFSYTGTPYCSTSPNPNPLIDLNGGGGTFASTSGLTITSAGLVDLSASTAGSYSVTHTIPAGVCPEQIAYAPIVITTEPTASIVYENLPYCTTMTSAPVTLNGTAAYTGGTFTSSPAGLIIDGGTGEINPSLSNAGVYTVSYYTPSGGGCSPVLATTQVTITALPTATISYSGTPYCSTVTSALVTLGGTGAYTGGAFTSSPTGLSIDGGIGEINPSLSTANTYTVTYTTPASGGCAAVIATTSVTINTLPVVTSITYGAPGFCKTITSAQNMILVGDAGGIYTATPAGLDISSTTGDIIPSSSLAGPYSVTYTVSVAGCADVWATTSVTITALPVATFSYIPDTYLTTDTDPLPTYSGGGVAGVFSATPAGLVFIGTAGQVDLSASTPGTYTVTNFIAAAGGCGDVTETSSITINAPLYKTLNVTVLIEGLYVGGGLMHEAYDYDDVLGLIEKWGTGKADTVTVVLYDNAYGNIVAKYPGVYLNTSGLLTIPTVSASYGDDYYITIFHRNSMPITTPTAQSFAGAIINYDFTTPADQAYGIGSQKDLGGGIYGMYTGELDHDAFYFIDGDDNTIMEPAVILSDLGYLLEDLNGSGYVDGDDNVIMEPNVIISPYFQNPLTAKKKLAPKTMNK